MDSRKSWESRIKKISNTLPIRHTTYNQNTGQTSGFAMCFAAGTRQKILAHGKRLYLPSALRGARQKQRPLPDHW